MEKFYYFLILGILISIGCSKNEEDNEPTFNLATPDNIDILEYKAYNALFSMFDTDTLIFAQKTLISGPKVIQGAYSSLTAYNENFDTTIVTDFIEKNDSAYNLDKKLLKIGSKYIILISSDEINYYFGGKDKNESWSKFTRKYSKDYYYNLSRVGFNKEKDQVLLEYTVDSPYSEPEATSVMHYLILNGNKWERKYNVTLSYD